MGDMPKRMHPFLRGIAAGIVATFVGSVAALSCTGHVPVVRTPRDTGTPAYEESEFGNLRKIATQTAVRVKPVVDGLINLVR